MTVLQSKNPEKLSHKEGSRSGGGVHESHYKEELEKTLTTDGERWLDEEVCDGNRSDQVGGEWTKKQLESQASLGRTRNLAQEKLLEI